MRNRPLLWRLHNQAKTYNCRPSDLLGLEDTHDRYCFDSAASLWGNVIESELNAVEGKNSKEIQNKRDSVLRRYIPELAKARKFADPGRR